MTYNADIEESDTFIIKNRSRIPLIKPVTEEEVDAVCGKDDGISRLNVRKMLEKRNLIEAIDSVVDMEDVKEILRELAK